MGSNLVISFELLVISFELRSDRRGIMEKFLC